VSGLAPAPTEADTLVGAGDEASLRKALELDPDHAGAIVALGQLLAERGDTEAALARVGAAGNGDSSPVDGVEQKLDALLDRVKDDDDARQQFVDLLELLGP